ncbi:DEAD/DEAH box helicase [Cryobacterium tepidiphilum]|uniref:DNA/RNA helicase n=1 Tax=Cryobacterium tepidiphilum TaxID=2486026 RepID=A0A3M8LBW2_9MICO|nr:DEAD/DEAH box helicase [Cryobacterium tepidiphilum]RNE62262.1 DNA/RNA helicase [Cryobacterium tepidiphilum]
MSRAAFPLVQAGDIIRLVGPASFERAQAYKRRGAVLDVQWDAGRGRLTGVVAGSTSQPYRCHIDLEATDTGFSRPLDSTCTCPMDYDCKHVAATLLMANATHLAETDALAQPAQREAVAPEPDWKQSLTDLARRSQDRATGAAPVTVMGLQFELREEAPRATERWRGPTTRPVSPREAAAKPVKAGSPDAADRYRLGVRPVIRSARGSWVKSTLTWGNITYQLNRLNLDPEQHRWFCQLIALHRAVREVYYGQEADWLYLDDFASPLLWQLLDEARRLGIAFVGTKKDARVRLGERAVVGLDARRSDEVLALSPTLAIDGHGHPAEDAGAVADHGVYGYRLTPPVSITLAPTGSPLTPEQRRILGRPATVTIPAADVAEFLTEFYPALQRVVEVTSADASVQFPEIAPPVLVLTARYQPKHTLVLDLAWENGVPAEATENAILDRVAGVFPRLGGTAPAAGQSGFRSLTLQGLDAAEFSEKVLPRLDELDGVRVDVVGARPDYLELTEAPKLTISTVETEERDWFDLGVVVTIEGRNVPFGPLFTALTKGHDKLLLVDNSYLSLKQPAFERLRELITEAQSLAEWETGVRISRYQAGLWADFEDLADETEQAVAWRASVAGLNALTQVDPAPLPNGLHATLRPYQRDGFSWLAFLWQHGLGGILADDMGLGKTLQALALLVHAAEHGTRAPFLVVAPTSVVSNWLAEAHRFAPGLAAVGITSTQTKSGVSLADAVAGAQLVVTSYALFRLDFEAYQAEEWAGLVLDEAQFVKNRASRANACARELAAPFKLAITGTPMENNLMELQALFHVVAPGLFPSARRFAEEYQRPIEGSRKGTPTERSEKAEATQRSERLARLRRRIRPLMMRRTKELVAADLPPKQEQVLSVDLEPRHRKLYDTFLQRERQKLLGLIEDLDRNRFIVFRSLTLLRMLSLDASLVDEKYASMPSSKLDALLEQLEDVVAEGHRALVFSQFTTFLGKAAARLEAQGVPYCYLDGSTLHRAEVINRFKSGEAPVFLISLKAGGFGLNLTEADYVFLLDPWWNPATEAQAVDRTHRIGQTKNVMVYRLVASGTIEEKVMALKAQKAKLFNAVLDEDAAFSSALTADDIRGLLE